MNQNFVLDEQALNACTWTFQSKINQLYYIMRGSKYLISKAQSREYAVEQFAQFTILLITLQNSHMKLIDFGSSSPICYIAKIRCDSN